MDDNTFLNMISNQIEKINISLDTIKTDNNIIKTKLENFTEKLDDLKEWKKELDENLSISEIKTMKNDINDLKNRLSALEAFKIKLITIFAVINTIAGILGWFISQL